MKPVSRAVIATALAVLLAFSVPAMAFAELSGVVSGLAPQVCEVLESAPDADGIRWLYQVVDEKVYVVGCDSAGESIVVPGVVTVAGPEVDPPEDPSPEPQSDANDAEDPNAEAPEDQQAAISDAPDTPGTPESQENPETPENPEDPEDSETPENPEDPAPEVEAETLPVYGVSGSRENGVNQWGGYREITLSPSIEVIANRAFMGCADLEVLTLHDDGALRSIGSEAFANSGVEEVRFPGNLQLVGDYAFYQCLKLECVTMASRDSALTLGTAAFRDCTNLKSVDLPDSMSEVNSLLFEGCQNLALDALPDAVASIGESAFEGCQGLALSALPDAVASIGESAFEGCQNLALSALPDAVASIGENAFARSGVKRMSFPRSLTRISNHAFSGCADLKSVSFSEGLKVIGCGAFNGDEQLKTLSFPASLTTIKGAGAITANGVTTEYEGSFEGCSSLTEVTFPETSDLESLGNASFCYCGRLAIVRLPKASNLKELGSGVFTGTAIESIDLPASVTSIGSYAFSSTPLRGLADSAYDNLRFLNGKAFDDCNRYSVPDYAQYGLDEQGGDYYRYDTKVSMTGTKSYMLANEVLESAPPVQGLNERVRKPAGVDSLVMDGELQEAAMLRATELPVRCEHVRPFDKSLDFTSVSPKAEKEIITVTPTLLGAINNFAQGQNGAILSDATFKSIGIGCFMQSNKYYWVILLSGEEALEPQAASNEETTQVSVGLRTEADYWPSLDIIAPSQGAVAGQAMQLSLTCQAPGGYPARVDLPSSAVFMSTDPDVALVDSSTGFVTFKKAGKVAVYANLRGAEAGMQSAWANFSVSPKNALRSDNVSIEGGFVSSVTFDGAAKTQDSIEVKTKDGVRLVKGQDYELSYENNVNAGTATIYITGINEYGGKVSTTFNIAKAPQTLKYTRVAKKVKAKRKKTVKVAKATQAKGALTYYNVSPKKAAKKLKVNKSTGKVKVPAKMKKGTYKLVVQAKADGVVNGIQNYEAGSKTVSLKVRVR